MDYNDYITTLASMLPQNTATVSGVVQFNDTNYQAVIPRAIEFAELLMYRDPDLDFLATRTTDATSSTAAGNRFLTIPTQLVVVEGINLIKPAGQLPDSPGSQRVRLTRIDIGPLDVMNPDDSATQPPTFGVTNFAIFDQQESSSACRIGPTVDDAYFAEFLGTFRPAPLSPSNQTTFVSANLPDLFLSASMIWWNGFLKNFGAAMDDPRAAVSWNAAYDKAKTGAAVEEARKKSMSGNWSPYSPPTVARSP